MTKKQFDKVYFNRAVHCDTEEKANHFLTLADSVGYKWFTEHSLKDMNYWETHEGETCYHITEEGVLFEQKIYYALCGHQIVEYEMQPKSKIMNKEKEELRNAIYKYAQHYYPDIDLKVLARESKRVANKVAGITSDAQATLTIMGILLSIVD